MEENINDYISDDNTYIGKLVHFWDTRGLPKKKINIILKDGITVTAYVIVPVLPPISQAEQGVFYILPDDSLNYVSNGHWRSIKPDGEDNTIEIIRDENGVALPINPTDKSVTLPVDTTYTFEDIYSSGRKVGWRVRNNKSGSIVYTYPDIDTSSDGVHKTSTTLSTTLGQDNAVLPANIEGFDALKLTIGETQLYDEYGTVAVVTAYDGTTVTAKTFTKVDYSDGVYRTNIDLTQDIGQTTAVLANQIIGLNPSDIVLGETLIYDRIGTVAVITAKAGVNLVATTITNTSYSESDGAYFTTAILPTTINAEMIVNKNSIPEILNLDKVVIDETLIYDEDGTVAKLIEITDPANEDMKFKVITSDQKNPPVFFANGTQLNPVIGQTITINRTDLLQLADKTTPATVKECIVNKTRVVDEYGAVGVITAYSTGVATVETITVADGAPFVLKADNMLSDIVGNTKAISLSNLKKFDNTAVDDSYKIIDKTLVFDTVRECFGLIVDITSGVATVKTIYSGDSPYVFITDKDLNAVGQDTNFILTTDKSHFTRIDDSTQTIEEYNLIPGKTTIYNPTQGRIAVIKGYDETLDALTVTTVYGDACGKVYSLSKIDGSLRTNIGMVEDLNRSLFYDNVQKIHLNQDLVYDYRGTVGVVTAYNATTDKVAVTTVTCPLYRVLWRASATTTKLPTTLGDTGNYDASDFGLHQYLLTTDAINISGDILVSDSYGTIAAVTRTYDDSGTMKIQVVTITTAGGDSGIYHFTATGMRLKVMPEASEIYSETELRTKTNIDWDRYASGKTLICDRYGTIATVNGPDDYDDYTLVTVTNAARHFYTVSTVTLDRTIGAYTTVPQMRISGLGDKNRLGTEEIMVVDRLGTIGLITSYDEPNANYTVVTKSTAQVYWRLVDSYAKNIQSTFTQVESASLTVPVDAISRVGRDLPPTVYSAATHELVPYKSLVYGLGNIFMVSSISGANVNLMLVSRSANHTTIFIDDLTGTDRNQTITGDVGDFVQISDTTTPAWKIVAGQTIYVDRFGTQAVVTAFFDSNRSQIQVRIRNKTSETTWLYTTDLISDKVGDKTDVGISDIYVGRDDTTTPAIASEDDYTIGQTLVFDNAGRIGVITGSGYDDYGDLSTVEIETLADSVNWNRGFTASANLNRSLGSYVSMNKTALTAWNLNQESATQPKLGDIVKGSEGALGYISYVGSDAITVTTLCINGPSFFKTDDDISANYRNTATIDLNHVHTTYGPSRALVVGDIIQDPNQHTAMVTSISGSSVSAVVLFTNFTGATSSSNGAGGLVPEPLIADRNKFLRGDASWRFEHTIYTDPNLQVDPDVPYQWAKVLLSTYPRDIAGEGRIYLTYYDVSSRFTNQPERFGSVITIVHHFDDGSQTQPSMWTLQFWLRHDNASAGLMYRYGCRDTWYYPGNGEWEKIGGGGAQIWRTASALTADQDATTSIVKATLDDPTLRQNYDKAKVGDIVIDTFSRMGQITAISGTNVTVKTLQRFFKGADATTAGAGGLVPTPLQGEQNLALAGDGTWSEFTRHEDITPGSPTTSDYIMTGATSSADGLEGFVPAPQAGDETAFLQGNGTWSTITDITSQITNENGATWGTEYKIYKMGPLVFINGNLQKLNASIGADSNTKILSGLPRPLSGQATFWLSGTSNSNAKKTVFRLQSNGDMVISSADNTTTAADTNIWQLISAVYLTKD